MHRAGDTDSPFHRHSPAGTVRAAGSLRTVGVALVLATGVVAMLGIVGTVCRVGLGIQHGPINFVTLLDFSREATIPAWYSSSLLLLAALLLGGIAWIKHSRRQPYRRHWLALSILFVLLSLDEGVAIHERLAWPIERIFQLQGIFYYGWVIPAMVLVTLVGIFFLRFLLHLPPRTRLGFIFSASVYIFAALGLEMIEGAYHTRHGHETAMYATLVAIEEILEMVGIAMFAYVLVDYLSIHHREVTIVLERPSPAAHARNEVRAAPSSSPRPGRAGHQVPAPVARLSA